MCNQIFVYLYNEIPLSNQRILNHKMDKSQKCHAEWKKPDANHYWNQINVCFCLYESLLKAKLVTVSQWLPHGWDFKGAQGNLGVMVPKTHRNVLLELVNFIVGQLYLNNVTK